MLTIIPFLISSVCWSFLQQAHFMAFIAFHLMLILVCTTFLYSLSFKTRHLEAAVTDKNEIEALRMIAAKLGYRDWNFTIDPCTSFKKLHCENCSGLNNTDCHVTNITLSNLNLKGVLPLELANLSYLVDLDLSDNYLTGPIPLQLGSMSSLKYLSLSGNLLSGPIPKELGNLTSLFILSLSGNLLSGPIPKELGNLTRLGELSLYSNNLSGTLPLEIGNLITLQNLYLSSNQFIGEIPPTFNKLQNLKEFFASSNGFTGKIPNIIGNLTKLQKLILQGTSLEGPIPSTISNLIEMTHLRISDLTQGGSDLDFIKSLQNLHELVLRNNNITAKIPDISHFNKLEALDLSFNNLIGHIPSSLNNLQKLRFLFLGNNNLSGSLPSWLANTKATTDLSYNQLSVDILQQHTGANFRVNLIGNILNRTSSTYHSPLACLQRNYSCNEEATNYHLAINCGGQQLKSSALRRAFDSDDSELGDSTFHLSPTNKNWGVSNIGYFMKHFIEHMPQFETPHIAKSNIMSNFIIAPHSNSPPTSIDSQLYNTARTSPASLRYYGLGLQNGPYKVELHFVDIQFPNTKKGVRIFDVYIQRKNLLKDFNLKEEAGEKNLVVVKKFTINVTENILEIHFFWAGKGTCCESQEETYGPLVSAIMVDPEFKPYIPKKDNKKVKIIVGVVVTLGLFLIVSLIFIKKTKMWDNILSFLSRHKYEELNQMEGKSFSLRLMKIATKNFDPKNKIGEGGFGAVYKGMLPSGRKVAIKQLSSLSKQGNREFLNEVSTISAAQHPNVVKLYGCCVEGGELLLVYEYMENDNLARAIFGHDEARVKLDWPTRYRICLGVARGLAYLHEESLLRIVHRDIKSTNILLDKDLNPKVADFGLARLFDEESTHVSTRVAGTVGYLAPEYALKGHLSDKSDVYSFGVVVLEIVSGRTHTEMRLEEERTYLLEWAWHLYEEKKMLQLVDVNLLQSGYNEEEMVRMIHVGLLCTHENPGARPCMSEIVKMMEGTLAAPAPQSRPGYLTFLQGWELAAGVRHAQAQVPTRKSSSFTHKEPLKDGSSTSKSSSTILNKKELQLQLQLNKQY